MNKQITIILFFLLSTLCGYSQIKSGIVFGGGKGSISNVVFPDEQPLFIDLNGNVIENVHLQWFYKYKFDVTIGYKFRIEPQHRPFFYDIDLNLGLKRFNTGYTSPLVSYIPEGVAEDDEMEYLFGASGHFQHTYYSFSVNPSWNYRLIKGLYAGAGIEPTLYHKAGTPSSEKWKFDLPLTAKVGYDLKFIDFSIIYKHGLFDTMEHEYLGSAKFRSWQLSVFIPF